MSKKFNSFDGLVFSTNKDLKIEVDSNDSFETIAPDKQKLRVSIDKRNRGGKVVTLITGFVGNDDDLNTLCKTLKTKCGVGGSAKDGEIIIQGEAKEKVINILKTLHYKVS
jgi:translation initiation factor 1